MKWLFVTSYIAEQLQKLGFKEDCFAYFERLNNNCFTTPEWKKRNLSTLDDTEDKFYLWFGWDEVWDENIIKAPLWEQALKFLREQFDCWIDIQPMGDLKNFKFFVSYKEHQNISNNIKYSSFLETREQAILKALKLINEYK